MTPGWWTGDKLAGTVTLEWADGRAVIARVVGGMDVVNRIKGVDTADKAGHLCACPAALARHHPW
ncbi:hypothetical protein ACIRD3_37990 [Kitasatospora sp. NPDC093550]|uniref:hypothetical protein n=1 Tax=Kitasatospora sp. NPDC093550 TaxID=3364089 RepID=UPI0037FD606D